MSTVDNRWLVFLLVPAGVLLLLSIIEENEEKKVSPSHNKEAYYLKYNKDEIFKGLLASESHFRNVEDFAGIDREGNLSCIVKHLADAESHLDEAVSHSAVCEKNKSEKFRQLRNRVRDFRRELQENHVVAEEGIKKVRALRREFESFNPAYDISKCTACEVTVSG